MSSQVLASAKYSNIIKVWDIAKSSVLNEVSFEGKGKPTSLAWNFVGDLLGTHCNDKTIKLLDPRNRKVVVNVAGHEKATKSKLTFLGQHTNYLCTSGFTKKNSRELALWDLRNMSARVMNITKVENDNGILFPQFDVETGLLYCLGKGDK